MLRTFDLNTVRLDPKDCPCPPIMEQASATAGWRYCSYGSAPEAATLIVHRNNELAWLSLIGYPGQLADAKIAPVIQQTLQGQASDGT